MTFGFLVGSRNFIRFFWVSWEVFVYTGWIVTTELTNLVPPRHIDDCSAIHFLHWDFVICCYQVTKILGPPESACWHYAYPNPVPLLLATALQVYEKNWKCLDPLGAGFLRGSEGQLSSTKFPLNSGGSQSGKSCNRSLCTSSRPSFLFVISVSVDECSGFSRSSSLILPLLSGTGFSVYLSTSNTESCDEDDEEVGVGVVEELAVAPRTTNGIVWFFCNQFSCPFRWDVVFDRWSSGRFTPDPRRAFREKELREFPQEA